MSDSDALVSPPLPGSEPSDRLLSRLRARCCESRRLVALLSLGALLMVVGVAMRGGGGGEGSAVDVQGVRGSDVSGKGDTQMEGDHEEAQLFLDLFPGDEDTEGGGGGGGGEEEGHVDCNATTLARLVPGTWQYEVRAADCGAGYDFRGAGGQGKKHMKIVLYGADMHHYVHLSGCPDGGHLQCPWSPGCQFSVANKPGHIKDADVVLVTTHSRDLIKDATRKRDANDPEGQFRVLYYREAYWPSVPVATQASDFDFEMGIHFTSGVVNPMYLRRPRTLLSTSVFPFLPFDKRPNFAMSIISDCHASSQRQAYIDHLSDYLGQHRVHQYGACGNRKLPPPPITHAIKVISTYKFYLSFENTIQEGYVTEKLMTVLNMGGIVPVYYGAPNAPNITTIPSYINVLDFPSPKALAQYLLYLEKHPEEFNKYNKWRSSPKYFSPQYLRLIQKQMPGQEELLKYRQRGFPKFSRRAQCCRLCDEDFVRTAFAQRKPQDLPHPKWHPEQINHHVFGGGMNHRPGSKARLDLDDGGGGRDEDENGP